MSDDRAIDVLNKLLRAESGNLIQRLGEANPYVGWPSALDRMIVQQMIEDCKRHQRELVEMILKLRGAPVSPRYPTGMGGVHYLKLSYLMPQVIEGVRSLIRVYESAGSTGDSEADALVNRILADHKRHLAELERLHGGIVQPA